MSGGEFGADALAAFRALLARPEVTIGAIAGPLDGRASGRSWRPPPTRGSPRLVATSGPADPYRLTRQTFRLARLPIPDPIAYPLAWLTTRVYLRPRGHDVGDGQRGGRDRPLRRARSCSPTATRTPSSRSATWRGWPTAVRATAGRRSGSRRRSRRSIVPGGQHSWLYEDPATAGRSPRFLARGLGGPLDPDAAGEIAAATPADRIPDAEARFAAVEDEPGGFRTLAPVALPGATRRRPHRRPATMPTSPGRTMRRSSAAGRADPAPSSRDAHPVWRRDRATGHPTFADRPLEPDHLERILRAGRHAGSSKNLQRWTFIVVPGPRPPAGALGRRPVRRPPGRRRRRGRPRHAGSSAAAGAPLSILFDLGLAAAEHDAGRLGARDRERAGDGLRATTWRGGCSAIPDDHYCEYMLSFGYPADPTDLTRPPKAGGRRPLDEMVHEERW